VKIESSSPLRRAGPTCYQRHCTNQMQCTPVSMLTVPLLLPTGTRIERSQMERVSTVDLAASANTKLTSVEQTSLTTGLISFLTVLQLHELKYHSVTEVAANTPKKNQIKRVRAFRKQTIIINSIPSAEVPKRVP